MKTSISDYGTYKNFCKKASENELIFNSFKTNSAYTPILEHTSIEQAYEYFEIIKKEFQNYDTYLEKFKENDLYGGPRIFTHPEIGNISPSTLRYMKVASDVFNLFGKNIYNICEVGIGYGGQSKILFDMLNIKKYTFFDLPEVNLLTKKYLSKFKISNTNFIDATDFVDATDLKNQKFDLFISNYAFTEIDISLQKIYLENLIKNSDNGYITCNFISDQFQINSMSYEDIIQHLKEYGKNIIELEEKPLTSVENKIIVWKINKVTI